MESDLGPLQGYRFLIGFGYDFAAMLAQKDYLIIEGAQLLNAQEKDGLRARQPISLYTTLYHPQFSVKKQTDELGSPRI